MDAEVSVLPPNPKQVTFFEAGDRACSIIHYYDCRLLQLVQEKILVEMLLLTVSNLQH